MKKIYAIIILTLSFLSVAAQTKTPITDLKSIFADYVKYQESTDSDSNKKKMIAAIKQTGNKKIKEAIPILLDIYLYYDPTDFPTRDYVLEALNKMKEDAMHKIKCRLALEKKKVESEQDFPYSDLKNLLESIEK